MNIKGNKGDQRAERQRQKRQRNIKAATEATEATEARCWRHYTKVIITHGVNTGTEKNPTTPFLLLLEATAGPMKQLPPKH